MTDATARELIEYAATADIGGDQLVIDLAAALSVALDENDRLREGWAVGIGEAVAAERVRQIEKGFDAEHDDLHGVGHLTEWAMSYARAGEHIEALALLRAANAHMVRALAKAGRS